MDIWRLIAHRKITEAMEEGKFRDLDGEGRPLRLDDEEPGVDPSVRMAHRVLKNNGFAPPWMEERKDLESALENFRASLRRAGPGADRARYSALAAELNRRIELYNLKAPGAAQHLLKIDLERELQ